MAMRIDHTIDIELPEKCWLLPTAIEYWCDEHCFRTWKLERKNKHYAILHFHDDRDLILFQLSNFTSFIKHH